MNKYLQSTTTCVVIRLRIIDYFNNRLRKDNFNDIHTAISSWLISTLGNEEICIRYSMFLKRLVDFFKWNIMLTREGLFYLIFMPKRINPFAVDNIIGFGWIYEPVIYITIHAVQHFFNILCWFWSKGFRITR